MSSSNNVPVVFIQGLHYENELNIILSPPNELRGDIRDLAAKLGFLPTEIEQKEYPFLYLLDLWIKRDGAEIASLQYLHSLLIEIERPDAARIVETAINVLNLEDPVILNAVAKKHNQKLKRSDSNLSLCRSFPINATKSCQNQDEKSSNKDTDLPPTAYVVHSMQNSEHLKMVEELVKNLRCAGINATADMFESKSSENQGYYIYSKLIDTEHVLYLCMPSSEKSEDENSEENRKGKYVMKLISDFLYDKGPYKSKYIPILLPGSTLDDVPFILRGFTTYNMTHQDFYDKLVRRICKIEMYELSPIREKPFKFKPKIIF